MGRPAREKRASTARLVSRCTVDEWAEAVHAAKLQGTSLSEFIREAVNVHVQAYHAGRDTRTQAEQDRLVAKTPVGRRIRNARDRAVDRGVHLEPILP